MPLYVKDGCILHQVDAVADFIYHIRLLRSVVNHEEQHQQQRRLPRAHTAPLVPT